MGLSGARKLLLILVVTAFVFSGSAEAWSWSWGSDQFGSNWGWGWGNSGGASGSGGSDSNSGGSSWGWGWSSNGTDTNWGWGSSTGSNHSNGTGSTHNGHSSASNHSSGTGSTHEGHSSASNHSSSTGTTHNLTAPISHRRKIEVTVWKSGFNYTAWASNHAPFHVKDVLDFKYNNDQTQSKTKHSNNKKNNVYLLPDLRSYKRCDVAIGKKLVARGGSSSGFKLLLRKVQTYYFASEDHNGCNHNMKFSVHPIPHPSSHLTLNPLVLSFTLNFEIVSY